MGVVRLEPLLEETMTGWEASEIATLRRRGEGDDDEELGFSEFEEDDEFEDEELEEDELDEDADEDYDEDYDELDEEFDDDGEPRRQGGGRPRREWE